MYQKLVGYKIKVVHKDGDKISVTEGELLEWNTSLLTLCVFKDSKNKPIFIHASCVEKLEPMELMSDDHY